ncbi:5-deoxy-glucuronate isomerase [Agromyces sp. G08B096]|uniref:5-deoxy-glucuronate isomerase n=1 Tax=Agromyces sp. G08B096 TaxID=3156399 RepID=A0AAU7W8I4_9MICO
MNDIPSEPLHDEASSDDRRTWVHPAGALARDGWQVVVDSSIAGWRHTALRVGEPGDTGLGLPAADLERLIVPLHGSFTVGVDAPDDDAPATERFELAGRPSVFSGPTDTLFLPPGAAARITGRGRVAVAEAPSTTRRPVRHLPVEAAPVELRGRGRASRQVHDLGTPAVLDADRLIVCEVLTPAGNWSSYPPHKHDEHRPGVESRLEEIYYFEVEPETGGDGRTGTDPFALFSASSSPQVHIEIDERVRTGDVVLLPGGYHGPAAAAPGYDLYYLNVMAGPGDRVWQITDEPGHAWVRQTWDDEELDPRLPFGAADRRSADDAKEHTP